MRRTLTVMALVLASCGSGASKRRCAARAHELSSFLGSFDHTPAPFAATGVSLAVRAGGPGVVPVPAPAPAVLIGPTGESLDGEQGLDRGELRARLERSHARRVQDQAGGGAAGAIDPGLLYLAIDEAATWERVVATAELAHASGYDHVAFAFARGALPPSPPRSAIDGRLDRVQASGTGQRATAFAAAAADVVEPCPALGRAFGAVGSTAGDRVGPLLGAIEPALIECGCKVDLPSLRSLMFRLLATEPLGFIQVTLDPAAAPLALPATMPWREAHQHLPAGGAHWPRIEDPARP